MTDVTTSATQTTAGDEDCDAMVPMVCVTSLRVRPYQSVLAQVRTDTDYLNSDPLLLQYLKEVDESLGVRVGDSLIRPGPDSASHVLLINTSGFTRYLQGGEFLGEAVPAIAVSPPDTETSKAFTITAQTQVELEGETDSREKERRSS